MREVEGLRRGRRIGGTVRDHEPGEEGTDPSLPSQRPSDHGRDESDQDRPDDGEVRCGVEGDLLLQVQTASRLHRFEIGRHPGDPGEDRDAEAPADEVEEAVVPGFFCSEMHDDDSAAEQGGSPYGRN